MADITHIDGADEINQPDFERAGVNEYIVRFEAAMDNPGLVDFIQGPGNPAGDGKEII